MRLFQKVACRCPKCGNLMEREGDVWQGGEIVGTRWRCDRCGYRNY